MFRDRLVEQHIRRRRRRHYNYWAFLWVAPVVVLVSIFSAYPLINSFILSLTNSSGSGYGDFVGLDNFVELFQDEVFWICMKNVVIFTIVGIVCGNFMTIMLAELLFNLKFKKTSAILRVLFILPVLVPSVVVLLVWENLIFSSSGPVIWSFWAYRLGLSLSRQPPQMKPSFTLVLMRWIFLPHIAHISAIFIGGGFDMHHLNCCLSVHRRCRTVSSNRLT